MRLEFTPRGELGEFEWESTRGFRNRIGVDREVIRKLSERSNLHGLARLLLYTGAMALTAWATVAVSRHSLLLAVPVLYAYWFLYGFWVAVAHELQHKMVFAKSWDRLSELIYFFVQALLWNSPRYARISHQLHHRYTMVRGMDPETAWPEVITTPWLRRHLCTLILNILVVGVPVSLYQAVRLQVERMAGIRNWMMRDHCTPEDVGRIRLDTTGIVLFHIAVVGSAIAFGRWEPILFITIAWQVGSAMETLWHSTEHIGRPYNVNDQRLTTRSVRVSPLLRLIYGGLDDHVDHHLYPSVPSRNLPKLHRLLAPKLAQPRTMIACWQEMFAIAREKDGAPRHEHIPLDSALLRT